MAETKRIFVVVLRYLVETPEIDRLRPQHVSWLDEHYAAGHFLASGRQTPGSGGVILARAHDRASVMTMLAADPFYVQRAAEYQVFEFAPTKSIPDVARLLQ